MQPSLSKYDKTDHHLQISWGRSAAEVSIRYPVPPMHPSIFVMNFYLKVVLEKNYTFVQKTNTPSVKPIPIIMCGTMTTKRTRFPIRNLLKGLLKSNSPYQNSFSESSKTFFKIIFWDIRGPDHPPLPRQQGLCPFPFGKHLSNPELIHCCTIGERIEGSKN